MAVAIMTLALGMSLFVASGAMCGHYDISTRLAGVLMAITNTVATVPGMVGVWVSGALVESTGSWNSVFYLAATMYVLGTAVYFRYGSVQKLFD